MLQPAAALHNASISAALMQDPSRIDPGSRLCAARAMGEGRGASVVSLLETPYGEALIRPLWAAAVDQDERSVIDPA